MCKKKSYKRKASVKRRIVRLSPLSFNAAGLAFAALFLLFAACGIEVYIYLEPVTTYINKPGSAADEALNYVAFVTSDVANYYSAEDYFKGFEIYYRIYNNLTTLNSDVTAIESYSEDDDTQALAYSYLISTKSYSRLTAVDRLTDVPLIEAPTSQPSNNRAVYIRIYNAASTYTAGVKVYALVSPYESSEDGTLQDNYGSARRTISGVSRDTNNYTFQLDYIKSGDADVSWSSSSTASDDELYVQFFVMAYGYDESFSNIYSVPYNLGYITLTKDYEDRGM